MHALRWMPISALLLSCLSITPAIAELGDIETFSDGGTPTIGSCGSTGEFPDCVANGWLFVAGGVIPDAGDDGIGDNALLFDSNGRGFHVATWEGFNTATENFVGNYLDAGVTAIRFRARHSGIGESVDLRSFAFNFDDGREDGVLSGALVHIHNTDTTW